MNDNYEVNMYTSKSIKRLIQIRNNTGDIYFLNRKVTFISQTYDF